MRYPDMDRETAGRAINRFLLDRDLLYRSIQSDGSLELLGLFRARFGNLLRESIVSIRVEQVLAQECRLVVWDVLSDGAYQVVNIPGLFRNAGLPKPALGQEGPVPEALFPLAEELLAACDSNPVAAALNLFTPHFQAHLDRIETDVMNVDDLRHSALAAQAGERLYAGIVASCAVASATELMRKVLSSAESALKAMPAFGLAGDGEQSYWEEIGAMLGGGGSVLDERMREDMCDEIRNAVADLSARERLLLWIDSGGFDDYLDAWKGDGSVPADVDEAGREFSSFLEDDLLDKWCSTLQRWALQDRQEKVAG